MELEERQVNDLGDQVAYKTQGSARASLSHDEDSVSYVKPIIKELVRTQFCFPNIKLLVDKIFTVKVPSAAESDGLEAYRMYLTDREKTIQAVVKRRLHKWLTTFDVREGSYVILKEYSLARGKRLHGEGDVFYLAISDFYSIGEEERSYSSTEPNDDSVNSEEGSPDPQDQAPATHEDERHEPEIIRTERSLPGDSRTQDIDVSNETYSRQPLIMEPKKRRRRSASSNSDTNLHPLGSTARKPGETPSAKIMRVKGRDDDRLRSPTELFSGASMSKFPLPQQNSTQGQPTPEQVVSPLQLSTLASVTGINASRNKQVNVLAMIEHVSSSTVKPTTAPLKRDVRIVDPSTDKKVILSVFIDPVNFLPKEYDIILFRDLTTHDFSGGNLNAYPKKCRGKRWYILNPYEIEECDMKSMELFREGYRKRGV